MYRIRTAQGTETVYGSLEEFSVAVKLGAVTPDDEIFHTRAGRWLDIKSHPHYRSALTWNGGSGNAAPVGAGVAPSPSVPARPAPSPAAPQTALRPQLQATPAPGGGAVAFVPPVKSKELTFLDTNGSVVPSSAQRNATIIEVPRLAPKPAPRPTPAPAVRPRPELQAGTAGGDFLVMDGGIESPVRTSSGHRAVGDDLDVLFDAPLPPVEAPRAAPKAAVATTSAAPVKPAALPVPVPKPAEKAAAAPAISGTAPAVVPAVAHAPKPVTTAARPALAAEADLDIPGGPLTAEVVAATPAPASVSPRPRLSLIAGGLTAIVAVSALLLWRPWQGSATATDAAAQTTSAGSDGTALPGATPVIPPAGYSGPLPGSAPAASGIKPVATIGPPAPPTDSAVEEPKEEIIAAVRPNFRADAVISTADIPLSSSVRGTTPTAVAPSALARHVEAAERVAQQELAVRLGSAGFRSVLTPTRIGSAEGAASARNAWIAGSEAIRQYRSRIGRIEKAYEDSMLVSQRAERWPAQELRAWGARVSLAEPGEVSQLADLMVSQITEALDLLAALSGQYEIKNDAISFRSPGAESRYTSIRNWVEQRTQNWSATPEAARPHSVTVILRALGDGLPAVK